MLIFRRWRGTRAEVRCDQIDFVSFWIERHGASAFLRGDFFDYREFVRRVLMNHAERGALAIRGERETCAGIKAASIDAFADRGRGNYFAGIGIDDRHHFVVTAGEEAAMRGVNREARWFLAWREGPARGDGELLRIDLPDFAFVFDVDVDVAGTVGDRKFRFSAERNCSGDVPCGSVDRGGV